MKTTMEAVKSSSGLLAEVICKKGKDKMNQAILMGRITKDVECKYTQGGMAVARFTVAVDRGKDKDGNDRGADFITCVAFGRTAENLEKFSGKGLRVAVTGSITTGSYEKDCQTVFTTEITAHKVEFIDWKESGGQKQSQKPAEQAPEGFAWDDESIPF